MPAFYTDFGFEVDVIISALNGHNCQITFAGTTPGFTNVIDNIGDILNTYTTNLPIIIEDMSSQCEVRSMRIKWGNTPGGLTSIEGTLPSAVTGGQGGDVADPREAYIMKKITATPGRRGRGRCFYPGVTEAHVNGYGNIDPLFLADLSSHGASFLAAMAAPPGGLTAYPVELAGFTAAGAAQMSPLVSFTPSPQTGLVRRRIRV